MTPSELARKAAEIYAYFGYDHAAAWIETLDATSQFHACLGLSGAQAYHLSKVNKREDAAHERAFQAIDLPNMDDRSPEDEIERARRLVG